LLDRAFATTTAFSIEAASSIDVARFEEAGNARAFARFGEA
jgi:hypothetical protein